MRTMTHPGPRQEPRILATTGTAAEDMIVTIPPGADLLTGIRDAARAAGAKGGAAELLGGDLGDLHYFTGGPDPTGKRLATYGEPTPLKAPVMLLSGNAIVGIDAEGEPLVHAHAVMVDRDGQVHGGHLPPGGCTVGKDGVRILLVKHDPAVFKVSDDPETNYAIFHPETANSNSEATA